MNERFKDQLKVFLLALGLFLLLFLGWKIATKGTEMIEHDINSTNYNKEYCLSLGGKVENEDNFLYPFGFECVGYDEDGFKFYYITDETGEVYKRR